MKVSANNGTHNHTTAPSKVATILHITTACLADNDKCAV